MFGMSKKDKDGGESSARQLSSRHSRGWKEVLDSLKSKDSLRVLDFGATSPANINYLTLLGHSVYMANIVQDAARPEYWEIPADSPAKAKAEFLLDKFVAENFDFSRREFDVILFWDTANFLPTALAPALFERLSQILKPGGELLAFFHGRNDGAGTEFTRYQITDSDLLTMHASGTHAIQALYQTRQIERFLEGFSNIRFILGKDNVREVIAIR